MRLLDEIRAASKGFAEWGDIFGDDVTAAALIDRLVHHAISSRSGAQLSHAAAPRAVADAACAAGPEPGAARRRRSRQEAPTT